MSVKLDFLIFDKLLNCWEKVKWLLPSLPNHRSAFCLLDLADLVDIKQTVIEVIIALKALEKDINTTIPLLVCQFEYLIFMVKTSSLTDVT